MLYFDQKTIRIACFDDKEGNDISTKLDFGLILHRCQDWPEHFFTRAKLTLKQLSNRKELRTILFTPLGSTNLSN